MDILAELEKAGIKYHYTSSAEWVSVLCPFHSDSNPSCGVNVEHGGFKCRACGAKGSFAKLLARSIGKPLNVVVAYLDSEYHVEHDKIVEPSVIEKYHKQLPAAKPLLRQLKIRAVTTEILNRYRIGEDSGRITIPVQNNKGQWVNIRRYKPGAKTHKITNMRGRGDARPYPLDQFSYENLVVFGGEVKALAAIPELNSQEIGAVTFTCGEENLAAEINQRKHLFANKKKVWVCLDIDETGKRAARNVAAVLKTLVEWVGIINLPLNPADFPKGDVNDYLGHEKGQLLPLLDCAEWIPESYLSEDQTQYDKIKLEEILEPKYAMKRVEFQGLITSINDCVYHVPAKVQVSCDKQQDLCGLCPIAGMREEKPEIYLPKETDQLLAMASATDKVQPEAIRKALRIPPCKSVEFSPIEFYKVEEAIVSPELDTTSTVENRQPVHVVAVDTKLELTETYKFKGKIFPHPRTQQATGVLSQGESIADTLSEFEPDYTQMLKFEPYEWTIESIQEKLDEVYNDLENNVTHIWERRDIHLLMDLAYHSCLTIPVNGRKMRGWVEVLIVGDSAQGKSDIAQYLQRHYGLGQRVECKSATVAGLLGGVEQIQGRGFFISWGIIPSQDRRLVILEEIKGMNPEVLAKLTDMRSSGVAEIPKIKRDKAHARTRLIVISNPRSELPIASYSYGIDAIRELVGNLEDVRRFDACAVVSKEEVSAETTQRIPGEVEHKFDSDSCRQLILWAWSRRTDQITIEDWAHLMETSNQLCKDFVDDIPVIDRGSMKLKLAKLATALAVRTFSTNQINLDTVLVRKCHVEYVDSLLRRLYTTKAFGYDRFSKAVKEQMSLKNPEEIERAIKKTNYAEDLILSLLSTTEIDQRDIGDWTALERPEVLELISLFVRKRAFIRNGRGYRKTAGFIELLEDMLNRKAELAPPDFVANYNPKY